MGRKLDSHRMIYGIAQWSIFCYGFANSFMAESDSNPQQNCWFFPGVTLGVSRAFHIGIFSIDSDASPHNVNPVSDHIIRKNISVRCTEQQRVQPYERTGYPYILWGFQRGE